MTGGSLRQGPATARPRSYPAEVLERIAELAESDPGREICGFVVARPGGTLEVVAVPNVADGQEEPGPGRPARTAPHGYLMDPRVELRVLADIASSGGQVAAVYHSHVEAGAHFSCEDREGALANGAPLLPGAEYLIVSVKGGVAGDHRRFVWDGRDFVDVSLRAD